MSQKPTELSQLSRPFTALTAGAIALFITSSDGTWTVTPDDNPILCGSCAVVRWLRVLDVAVTKISTAATADVTS